MNLRVIPIVFVIVYGAALAALAIFGLWTAFLIVAVIGGPTTSLLFWLRARGDAGRANGAAPVKP